MNYEELKEWVIRYGYLKNKPNLVQKALEGMYQMIISSKTSGKITEEQKQELIKLAVNTLGVNLEIKK